MLLEFGIPTIADFFTYLIDRVFSVNITITINLPVMRVVLFVVLMVWTFVWFEFIRRRIRSIRKRIENEKLDNDKIPYLIKIIYGKEEQKDKD